MKKARRVGLVLGGGGARGWAHVGVIRALQDAGIPVDVVAGTSIGALVGAAFAAGRIDDLEAVILGLDWKQVLYYFLDVSISRSGLVDGSRIVSFVRRNVVAARIEELSIPFRAVATDLLEGSEVVLSEGDVIDAVRASISVPGIFTPVRRGETLLVDGGLVNPVPVSVARNLGADVVIAVDINRCRKGAPRAARRQVPGRTEGAAASVPQSRLLRAMRGRIAAMDSSSLARVRRWIRKPAVPHVFEILGSSVRIMEAQLSETLLARWPPEMLVQPEVRDVDFFDFHRARELIDEGYRSAREQILANPRLVARL